MSSVRIVLQARMTSSRLPGKVLLPIAGLPIAVLAARRAMSGGTDLVVATSDEATDDPLVDDLQRHGVQVIRGPLDDVLGRFVLATSDLDENAICVRLTGDNVFPDADFLERLIDRFLKGDRTYLGLGGGQCQLPYGLAAEVFTVGTLREADVAASDPADREHVTPFIKRKYPDSPVSVPGIAGDWGHLRCTIDTLEDYLRVRRVFGLVGNDVTASWRRLVQKLQELPDAPSFTLKGLPGPAMVLGTVQLGMPYGRVGIGGVPSAADAREILKLAAEHGVQEFDTARAYGSSEERVGAFLADGWSSRVTPLTKLDPLDDARADWSGAALDSLVDASVLRSCHALRAQRLPLLMLHRAEHLDFAERRVWRRLLELQCEGRIEALGCSVQTSAELRRALSEPEIAHVQLPYNVLDRRWNEFGSVLERRRIRVHVRSVLLQGLLTPAPPSYWPTVDGVDPVALVKTLEDLAAELGRTSVIDLCIAFVRSRAWIDGVVIGVQTPDQLRETMSQFRQPPLSPLEADFVRQRLPECPEALVNPTLWPPVSA